MHDGVIGPALEDADLLVGRDLGEHAHLPRGPADLQALHLGVQTQTEVGDHFVLFVTPAAENFPSLPQVARRGDEPGADAVAVALHAHQFDPQPVVVGGRRHSVVAIDAARRIRRGTST